MSKNVEQWVRERIEDAEGSDGLRFENEEELERYVRAMERLWHRFKDASLARPRRPWSAP